MTTCPHPDTAVKVAQRIVKTTRSSDTVARLGGDEFAVLVEGIGSQRDAERLAETKRDLIDAAELRQLVRHRQAVAIIDTAPPIKFPAPD